MRILLPIVLLFVACIDAAAQSCRPAELHYFVRDESGKQLSETRLKGVARRMPRPAPTVSMLGLTDDDTLVGYSGKPAKTTRAALSYADAETCHIKVGGWTLSYGGKTMRLIFDLDFERRAFAIESLPFRAGTYHLDQKGLADTANNEIIPASRWKRVRR
jgi:hypothetical protein